MRCIAAFFAPSLVVTAIGSAIGLCQLRARESRGPARISRLARDTDYDGVEVMGSEGYLINLLLVERTHDRRDGSGGSLANRQRMAIEIVQGIRAALGPDFILIDRLSMLDLTDNGQRWDEIVALAPAIEAAALHSSTPALAGTKPS